MRNGKSRHGRNRLLAARLFLAVAGSCVTGSAASGEDLSEALRLWKFTYKLEIDAYGVQYMSKKLLRLAGDQLVQAAGQTVVTNNRMTTCIDASNHLAAYFHAAARAAPAEERRAIRVQYEGARAGCMRLLGADPQEYPLGWPD